ncbi:MAG: hypothetical protein KDB80_17055 [Planctomycetes bacterium]|nr:hypothetical protein [Planctomycetota bacterium]
MSVDPKRLRPWIRRAILVAVVVMAVLLYRNYGWLRVPAGMDTMPADCPAGALCIIAKQPSAVQPGSIVFVDLATGGTVVTRVQRVVGDDIVVSNDNRNSRFAFDDGGAVVSIDQVRALVITVLTDD